MEASRAEARRREARAGGSARAWTSRVAVRCVGEGDRASWTARATTRGCRSRGRGAGEMRARGRDGWWAASRARAGCARCRERRWSRERRDREWRQREKGEGSPLARATLAHRSGRGGGLSKQLALQDARLSHALEKMQQRRCETPRAERGGARGAARSLGRGARSVLGTRACAMARPSPAIDRYNKAPPRVRLARRRRRSPLLH